ncbi:hypothetical protein J6Z19_06895 [bacterium]|nr:hypothetical protein [bacterium]
MKNFMKSVSYFFSQIPRWGLIIPILAAILFRYFMIENPQSGFEQKAEKQVEFNIVPTESDMKVFEIVNNLPHGSKVLILVNYGPESRYELETAMSALIVALAEKNIGIAFATMIPNGIESAFMAVEKSIENGSFGKERFVYGHEYTHLGFIVGGTIASYLIANNFGEVRERDIFDGRTDIRQPLMSGINAISDFSAVFEFSSQTFDGIPGLVSFAATLNNKEVKKVAFCSSDMLPAYIPFYNSLYFDGLVGGFKSIAVFIHEINPAIKIERQYNTLSMILLYIIGLVVFANLINFGKKDKR